jgi:hypothetical protein
MLTHVFKVTRTNASIFHIFLAQTLPILFFGFRTGFQPIKGERLIRLMCGSMRTGQLLFPLEIEPGILQVRPWKELLATEAQTTRLTFSILYIYDMIMKKIIHLYFT